MIDIIPQTTEITFGESHKPKDIKLSQSEQVASRLKARLRPIAGVEAALFEDTRRTSRNQTGLSQKQFFQRIEIPPRRDNG